MKKRIAFSIVLLMALCLILNACSKKDSMAESGNADNRQETFSASDEKQETLSPSNVEQQEASGSGDEEQQEALSPSDEEQEALSTGDEEQTVSDSPDQVEINTDPAAAEAQNDIYSGSAWTAVKYCAEGDGDYKDVMSNDYAVALFFDNGKATAIRYGDSLSFAYRPTADGFVIDEDIDMLIEASVDGDTMTLKIQRFTFIMERTDIDEALSYARSLVGPDYPALPFENDGSDADVSADHDSLVLDVSYTTLVDDEICTIRSAGAFMVPVHMVPEPEETAAYLLSITNNSSQTIKITEGYLSDNPAEFSYGTINGQKIPAVVYADAHSSSPYVFGTAIQPVPSGETAEIYLCAVPDVMTWPTLADLTDVSVNLYASNNSGDFWYCNYTLPLD